MKKIVEMTISEIKEAYRKKDLRVIEVVKAYFDQIKAYDQDIKAFISLREKEALEEALTLDARLDKGETLGLLGGIPVAVKDNISTKDLKTTCASKMLEDYQPPYDATVVKKLKAADAIIIGKTNMDEFAMGSSTENSAMHTTKNPWDLTKVPGGSSGGSAAALAAGFAPLTIGSDTGGSIRQPASFCSVVGLKPSYHRVSRFGLIAFASSLDQVGPFTRSIEDSALALKVLQGKDPLDNTSKKSPNEDYLENINQPIYKMKIGVPKEFLSNGLNSEIRESIIETMETLRKLGAIVEEFSLPISDAGLSAYYIISSAEASSNLARYDGIRYGYRPEEFKDTDDLMLKARTEGFGKEVKRRIMLGTYALSSGYYDAYYKKAMKFRSKVTKTFSKAFEDYDVILSPTSPILPFGIGEKTSDPLEMYLADIYTVNINVAGLPALSMPSGFSSTGLPIGIQLIGNHFEENTLFRVGNQLEKALKINRNFPKMEVK